VNDEIYTLSASEIVNRIKSKELSVLDLASVFVSRINKVESRMKAWAYFDERKFIKQAEIVDKKINSNGFLGSLVGVPVGIKDIFNTSDTPTCMGSPLWKDFTPGNDARVVSRFREEDGIIAGKTHTSEFAVHEPGPTRNPHNLDYYPGTSSSGSAVAVACGMVPVALGSQTAGSIIRPASYCGVYGFKPTFGLIPRTGMLKTTDSLDQIGWFARNIDDIRLLFDGLRVKGQNYPYVYKYIDKKSPGEFIREKMKIAFVRCPQWEFVEKYAEEDFYNFIDRLSELNNIDVEEIILPPEFDSSHDVHETIYDKELAYYFKEEYENKEFTSNRFCEMVERGINTSMEKYRKAQSHQILLRNRLNALLNKYDTILTLSSTGEAPKFSNPVDKPDSCLIWTLCGVPVINVPVFSGPNGLPFGLQIIAKRYNDLLLLNYIKLLEEHELVEALSPVEVYKDVTRSLTQKMTI